MTPISPERRAGGRYAAWPPGDRDARRARAGEETVRVGSLVGCDGAHSAVRKGLGLSFAGDAFRVRCPPRARGFSYEAGGGSSGARIRAIWLYSGLE
jgi:2-polyprenyl-6-methoxyphenol hydroxylase-like FAD-dependent oxidoreductase